MHHSALGRSKAPQTYLLNDTHQLTFGRIGTTVIAYSYFTADHFINENQIIGNTICQCRSGKSIVAGKHIS